MSIEKELRIMHACELGARDSGKELAGSNYALFGIVKRIAKTGAYTAKYLASSL